MKKDQILLKCAGCKGSPEPALYCSRECQKLHWPVHKSQCPSRTGIRQASKAAVNESWEDPYRLTDDGSYHLGTLELVTWDFKDLGWGGTYKEESAQLKAKYEGEMQCSNKKLLKYFDSAFRWTCCGMCVSEGVHGCDHHGDLNNPRPCACDYCRAGLPLPDKIFNKKTTHKVGLALRRGPDPRSFSEAGVMNFGLGASLGFIKNHDGNNDGSDSD